MISFIKGRLSEVFEDSIIIDHDGIGFEIRVPLSVLQDLPVLGEELRIYTYMYVREEELSLYGFLTRDDMNVFKQLITVSGIGPKGALAILSTISAEALRYAVLSEDAKAISAAPGIGIKTAQKLIIELKGRLGDMAFQNNDVPGFLRQEDTADARSEAVAALTALGYSNAEAVAAVKKVEYSEEMDSEAVLKASLKHLTFI